MAGRIGAGRRSGAGPALARRRKRTLGAKRIYSEASRSAKSWRLVNIVNRPEKADGGSFLPSGYPADFRRSVLALRFRYPGELFLIMKILTPVISFVLFAAVRAFGQDGVPENPLTIFTQDLEVGIARGMTHETVHILLGSPNEIVATNIWVYWNFRGTGVPDAAKYDTLILVFKDGQVSTLRLCESKPVRELIAKLKVRPRSKALAAK